jgi:hypothetical protein
MKTLAAFLVALATTAQATDIFLHGTIASTDLATSGIQVGDAFTGTFVFDPNQPFDESGQPNVSLDVFITTVLGTAPFSLDAFHSQYTGGFGPSIFGEARDGHNVISVEFLSPDLHNFSGGIVFFEGQPGDNFLGFVNASGITSIPESASTFTLFALGFAGVAILPWMRKRPRRLRLPNFNW